jgi:hypothetical protein
MNRALQPAERIARSLAAKLGAIGLRHPPQVREVVVVCAHCGTGGWMSLRIA